ncbi:hypothetical protein SpCBS45565_g05336 [Spizellomyces sp. 'palustris']|nr:hypothetical protein SpCBS45565_g05336 [Spizellomyces sp. 'palustris']
MSLATLPTKTTYPIKAPPSPPPVPDNWPRCLYNEEQIAQLDQLKELVPPLLTTGDERTEEEAWCDDACLLRYLRATKWNVPAAAKRLENTLAWRREYKPHKIDPAEVEEEAKMGKQIVSGFDLQGRPLIYMIPRKEHTKTYDRQLRFVVFNLERAIRAMPPGVESLNLVIDYEGVSVRTSPPSSQAKKVLAILGDHYPERLGMGFMINPSWYLWVFFKIIGPFLDPITRSKIHFVNLKKQADFNHNTNEGESAKEVEGMGGWTNIRYYIGPDQLLKQYGGEVDYEHVHDIYWKAITA